MLDQAPLLAAVSAVAQLVQGRPRAEVAELLPRLFNLCRAAQGAAIRLALGFEAEAKDLPREIACDHLMRLGMNLPARLGLARLPIADGGSALWAERCPQTMPQLRALMVSGIGLGLVLQSLATRFAPGQACADLPPVCDNNALQVLALENSPALRHLDHPLLIAVQAQYGRGPLWRVVARLLDLNARLTGSLPGPRQIGPDAAVTPAARGVYAICVQTTGDRVTGLTPVTPTDHMLVPTGMMALSLASLRPRNHSLAPLLVDTLDPCCEVQITGGHIMHEMSLWEGIRSVIEQQARAHGFARVKRVRLEIGRFAGVEKPALEFAFDVVMRGSPAEGAAFEMIDLPGRAMCYDCIHEVEIVQRLDPCPDCGGGRLMPVAGDEMRIKDMEVL